jgi:hypothetical protein
LESLENLQIGTYGWQYDSWLGEFYPEDLPADWQLDYFSNAFRVVLVPQSAWLAWSDAELQAINEAVEAPFYFYFAVETALDIRLLQQLEKIVAVLKSQVTGVVVWSEERFNQTELAGLPVTLVSTQYRLPGWRWLCQGLWMSGQPLAYISELTLDPKAQVALLKDFMQSLSVEADSATSKTVIEYQGVPCIVGGEKIDMQQVANLKTLGEFLGF